jgi:hypothetical protein
MRNAAFFEFFEIASAIAASNTFPKKRDFVVHEGVSSSTSKASAHNYLYFPVRHCNTIRVVRKLKTLLQYYSDNQYNKEATNTTQYIARTLTIWYSMTVTTVISVMVSTSFSAIKIVFIIARV